MSARWDDRALIDRSAKDPEYHVLTDASIFKLFDLEYKRMLGFWLPIVNDVRTALIEDPLPLETVKGLLTERAGADAEGEMARAGSSPSSVL